MFASNMQTIVNTVNCVGVMGKGIAQIFKKEYPAMFEDYADAANAGKCVSASPTITRTWPGVSIVNFPTKGHWRAATRLRTSRPGLDYFVKHFRAWGITSVAFPPLGCGNGGLEWATVGPLMYSKLKGLEIPVEFYAPYGTPAESVERGVSRCGPADGVRRQGTSAGEVAPRMGGAWWRCFTNWNSSLTQTPSGRTIFQKICYILTKQGVDTGFQFERNSYGPFADEVKEAINVLANNNWVTEQQLGQMTALRVGPEYAKARDQTCGRTEALPTQD